MASSSLFREVHELGPSVAALLTRLTTGCVFATSGWGKLEHLDQIVDYFRSLEVPWPEGMAPFVAGLEAVGGVLILIGLMTRLISLPLMGTMVVAIATAKRAEIESWLDVLALGEFLFIVLFAQLALTGAGRWSLDARRAARRARWQTISAPPAS